MGEPAPLKPHGFVPSKWTDNRGVRICECGSAKDAAIHRDHDGWKAAPAARKRQ